MRRKTVWRTIVAAVAIGIPDSGAAPTAEPAPTALFGSCPDGTPAGVRCGTVAVPLDRTDPAGTKMFHRSGPRETCS